MILYEMLPSPKQNEEVKTLKKSLVVFAFVFN